MKHAGARSFGVRKEEEPLGRFGRFVLWLFKWMDELDTHASTHQFESSPQGPAVLAWRTKDTPYGRGWIRNDEAVSTIKYSKDGAAVLVLGEEAEIEDAQVESPWPIVGSYIAG